MNWILKELEGKYEIISETGYKHQRYILEKYKIPTPEIINGLDRDATQLDWGFIVPHSTLQYMYEGDEEQIKPYFRNSELVSCKNVIIIFNQSDPAIKMPVNIFIDKWKDVFAGTQYETIVFSEDYKLFMETTRNFTLYLNFKV